MVSMDMNIKKNFAELSLYFDALAIFRQLLQDDVFSRLHDLIQYFNREERDLSCLIKLYNEFYFALSKQAVNSLEEYIIEAILFDENPFSNSIASDKPGVMSGSIMKAVSNDLDNLQLISGITASLLKEQILENYCKYGYEKRIVENLPEWNTLSSEGQELSKQRESCSAIKALLRSSDRWSGCIHRLTEFYKASGSGMFARFGAFIWEHSGSNGYLRGVESPDPVKLSNLIDYNDQRSEVISNTLQFLKGFQANNVLLYGDRGTGKSSTVKAIFNEYYKDGLRLIEVPKNFLMDFPEIIRLLKGRNQKFILFVDDLAFEDNEESYTGLKAVLEGGIENKPGNVLIYATSNRRHLVKEKFSDRVGFQSGSIDDEVRSADTMQEKLSLADRFGITVVFSSPDKKKYLKIVEGLAEQRGIKIDRDKLHSEASKWELWYNGPSPRTARQFVDWLESQVNSGF